MKPSLTEIRLEQGDCVEKMRSMDADSVDVVVTSPPYNLGIGYSKYKDKLEDETYLDWCMQWAGELARVLKEDGSFFLNVAGVPAKPLLPHALALRLSEIFVLQNTFHWVKSVTVKTLDIDALSVGHFKPINSPRYVTDCHEYVFHFTLSGKVAVDKLAIGVPYADKSNIARWKHTGGEDKRCRGNVWYVPYQTIQSRNKERPHPATFPVELAENCIRLHGDPALQTVLDPFMGIGHTARAAVNCGCARVVGFDLDEGYLNVAREHLSQLTSE